jgi:hypothetical protein
MISAVLCSSVNFIVFDVKTSSFGTKIQVSYQLTPASTEFLNYASRIWLRGSNYEQFCTLLGIFQYKWPRKVGNVNFFLDNMSKSIKILAFQPLQRRNWERFRFLSRKNLSVF